MAILRQDLYFGAQPRLHALRLGPYGGSSARLLFHPDDGTPLDDSALNGFMEDLADRIEIVCLDPGALADPRHPDRLSLIRDCLAAIDARWPERLPVILAGHGRGGMLALALADSAPVQGVVALAPIIASLHEQKQHDLASRIDAARIPLLAVFHDDVHVAPFRAALERSPLNTVVRLPGDGSAALTRPIATFVAEWSFAAVSGRDCSSRNMLSSSRIGLDGA